MSDVIDLAKFAQARNESANTELANAATGEWYRRADAVIGSGGSLSAAVLSRLDIDSELGRFLGLVQSVTERLVLCQDLMKLGDTIGADDEFIACKPLLTEMLMYRGLSDAVGLIVLKCLQIATSVKAIVDAPAMPPVLQRTLARVRMAPFMKFEEACTLVEEIEKATLLQPLPGLSEFSSALVDAALEPPTRAAND